jgi:hypothetical protein
MLTSMVGDSRALAAKAARVLLMIVGCCSMIVLEATVGAAKEVVEVTVAVVWMEVVVASMARALLCGEFCRLGGV